MKLEVVLHHDWDPQHGRELQLDDGVQLTHSSAAIWVELQHIYKVVDAYNNTFPNQNKSMTLARGQTRDRARLALQLGPYLVGGL